MYIFITKKPNNHKIARQLTKKIQKTTYSMKSLLKQYVYFQISSSEGTLIRVEIGAIRVIFRRCL